MSLLWTDLTPEEQDAVQEAYEIAKGREAIIYRETQGRHGGSVIDELESFGKKIDELSPEALQILGRVRKWAVTGEVPPRNAMEEIRSKIYFFTEGIERTAGRRTHFARIEAAEILQEIWIERGFKPTLGAVRREKKSFEYLQRSPLALTPFLTFVADCFLVLDPDLNDLGTAAGAAHSTLRQSR